MLKAIRNFLIGIIIAAAALFQLGMVLLLVFWGVWEWQSRDWSYFQEQTDELFSEDIAWSTFTPGELFDFEWDEAYILRNGYGTGPELKKKYGLDFAIPDTLSDTHYRLLFFKDGQLIETKYTQYVKLFSRWDYLFESGMDGFYPETTMFAEQRKNAIYFIPLDPTACIWDGNIMHRTWRDYPHFEHYWFYYEPKPLPVLYEGDPPGSSRQITRLQAAENILREFFDKEPQQLQTNVQGDIAVVQAETKEYGRVKIVANDLYKDAAGNFYYQCLLWPGASEEYPNWVDEVYVDSATGEIFLPPPNQERWQQEYGGQIYGFDVERTVLPVA